MSGAPDFGQQRDFFTFAPELLGQALPEFAIERQVGQGSMGLVYEARRRADGQRVALKVLPPSLTLTERTLARFLREGRVMARVQHPQIVRYFGQGQGDAGGVRLYWFAMEFVDGKTLQERLQVGPLPARHACRIAAQTGRALHYAHERGVVHRDVKPGNIMLRDDDGEPSIAITDFGLARETGTGSMTDSGAIVGTPMYMAPELVLGGTAQAGTLADVYSLGATLYTLATGTPPFEGPTAQSVLKAVVDHEPPRPRQRRADLPPAVEAIILKAMAKAPRDRYGSALELAEDLERFVAGQRVLARLPGPARRSLRFLRRRPLMTALLLLVLVLAAGAFAWANERRQQFVLHGLAETENWLALAASAVDEQDRPRSSEQRRELLLAAAAAASDVIARDPGEPAAFLLRAKARLRLRQYDEAVFDLDAAERLVGAPTPPLLQQRIEALHGSGDPASLRRLQHDLTQLLGLDPSHHARTLVAEHLLELADLAVGLQRTELLLTAKEMLAAVPATDARAAVLQARLLEANGNFDAALATMRQARRQHAGNVYVHLQAASLYDRLGLGADALREREAARLLAPDAAAKDRAAVDLEGLGGFLHDVNQLLQELDAGRGGDK